ncbi:MAG: glycosyltransferase family 4 protein [Alphaproteobacteria bacterium]|nr:glycosyltransferase family 4 protein [Alphaproteobacteria bacterium]
MRGGEKVLESLCRMFPEADIFTHVHLPGKTSALINSHRIATTSVARLPFAGRLYQHYLPFMPRALEEIDLTGYDLVISSEAGPAKGVIVPPDVPHLCYCHSPMRYIWDQYHIYRSEMGRASRLVMPHIAHRLRGWDVTSAARVDGFIANSNHVAARIQKYWRRDADIVHPPVAVADFAPAAPAEREEFYLWAGELAPYKRPDLAVRAFRQLDKPLVVIGGPDKTVNALKSLAGDKTTFLGKVPFDVLKNHMARCKALIFPGEEDFGIVPVEVMASGRPVIAYGRGGALDTVVDRKTGLLFQDQSVDGLVKAIRNFEAEGLDRLSPISLIRHAKQFDEATFQQGIAKSLTKLGVEIEGFGRVNEEPPVELSVGLS